jgi:hypothetical protein
LSAHIGASSMALGTLSALAEAVRRATPWKPASQVSGRGTLSRIERGTRRGRVLANDLGHTLTFWENDTDDSAVAWCLVCEEIAAVDASHGQPTEFNGRVFTEICAGPYSRGVIR